MTLTKKQIQRLKKISEFNNAAYFDTSTDRSLLKRGLIERCDKKMGTEEVNFTIFLCRISGLGKSELELKK